MSDLPADPDQNARFGIHVPKSLTAARLGIGRTGGSLTTREIMDFDLAHARARDAVLQPWDVDRFESDWKNSKCQKLDTLRLTSGVSDRATYLRRPDWGRRLSRSSADALRAMPRGFDLAVIVSDGLSAQAVSNQARLVLEHLIPAVKHRGWSLAPLLLVPFARVGITDPIGEAIECRSAVILLGERPGLATPESLGAYFTYEPRIGRNDADRNCLSNIHAEGLRPAHAAESIVRLIEASFRLRQGGVALSVAMTEPTA